MEIQTVGDLRAALAGQLDEAPIRLWNEEYWGLDEITSVEKDDDGIVVIR